MDESATRSYRLAEKFSHLFDLESRVETVLSVSMYYLNQFLDAERSSIFLFQHWNQQLTIFSSLDLEKHEINIPKDCGIAGWVFGNREAALVNDVSEDHRFCCDVDEMTGFCTRNLICTRLLHGKEQCLGTLQSLNKRKGDFTTEDLELLNLAARMVAVAINNSRRYNEILVTSEARKKFIKRITASTGDIFARR